MDILTKINDLFKKYNTYVFEDGSFEYKINVNGYFLIFGTYDIDNNTFDVEIEPTERGLNQVNENDLDWFLSMTGKKYITTIPDLLKFYIDFYEDIMNHGFIINRGMYFTTRRYKMKLDKIKAI